MKCFTQSDYNSDYVSTTIFAKDEHSFWRFDSSTELSTFLSDKFLTIYESRCEGRELNWKRMMVVNLEVGTSYNISNHPWKPPSGCVILEFYSGVFVYDYRDRKLICKLSGFDKLLQSFEDGGALVSHATFCDYYSLQFKKAIYYVDMLFA